jgi:hypothetical protein
MMRSKEIFDWIFGLNDANYNLYYLESPDVGISAEALLARKAKEDQGIATVRNLAKQYKSLDQVWTFVHTKHDLYTASRLVERGSGKGRSGASDLIKKTYGD